MTGLLGPGGLPIQAQQGLKMDSMPSIDETLPPEEVAKLDFQPLGTQLIIEALAPKKKSDGGIHAPFGIERPLYRILRFGSAEYLEELTRTVKLGDIVFGRMDRAFRVQNTYPRLPGGDERKIAFAGYGEIDGVFPGHAWPDPDKSKRKVGEPMIDFQDDFIEAVRTEMATPEDAAQIDFIPIADKIIVEQVPTQKKSSGGLHLPGLGRHTPIFRILKMPANKDTVLAPHLRMLKAGDVVMIHGISDADNFPTNLKNANGAARNVLLTHAGMIIGWWPSLSWDAPVRAVHSIDESMKAVERHG
jgi:co-chaperonin GroES (HSP10)